MEWILFKTMIFILGTAHARTPTPGFTTTMAATLTQGVCEHYIRYVFLISATSNETPKKDEMVHICKDSINLHVELGLYNPI